MDQPSGEAHTSCSDRLQQYRSARYAEHDREQEGKLFSFDTQAIRQEHDAILEYASCALAESTNAHILTAVAALVLLDGIAPVARETLTRYVGEDIAERIEAVTTHFDSDSGNAVLWEKALSKMASAPADAQTVRLALLLGQLEYSPEASGHFPFWHREAKALTGGDPLLQLRVLEKLEAARRTR